MGIGIRIILLSTGPSLKRGKGDKINNRHSLKQLIPLQMVLISERQMAMHRLKALRVPNRYLIPLEITVSLVFKL